MAYKLKTNNTNKSKNKLVKAWALDGQYAFLDGYAYEKYSTSYGNLPDKKRIKIAEKVVKENEKHGI